MASSRRPISTRLRYRVFERDGFACRYCGAAAPNVILHVDHIHPVSAGGTDELENLTTACSACNQGKADLMPTEKEATETVEEVKRHPLVGWGFLSIGKDQTTEWQGIIRDVIPTGTILGDLAIVDFMEWIGGGYTYSQLIPLAEMCIDKIGGNRWFKLFPTNNDRNEYYETYQSRRDMNI